MSRGRAGRWGPDAHEACEIRRAEGDHASAIAAVLYEAFAEYRPLCSAAGFAATTPNSSEVRARIGEGPVWVALQGGAIVGTVSAVVKGVDGLYVRGMAVLPEVRGQRMGRRLPERVDAFARQQGCERLFLSTTPSLRAAIRLYERSGFRPSSGGPHGLFGTPLFTMVKILRPFE